LVNPKNLKNDADKETSGRRLFYVLLIVFPHTANAACGKTQRQNCGVRASTALPCYFAMDWRNFLHGGLK